MVDPRYEIWAKTLVGYSVEVQPGQTVAISGGTAAEPLLRAIYREVLARGGFPVPLPTVPGLAADLLRKGTDDQLRFISPLERFVREEADVAITVMAETNTRTLSQVDPARQTVFQSARSELFQTFMRRAAEGTMTWVGTLFPTDA
ncbi:MAG: aminopeptidase, partial [Chloroflexota bacterium]|nr:aminopeptidase [Chloroflexota bacterium]